MMTKIILCGCNGKMGHVIHSMILSDYPEMTIVAGVDANTQPNSDFPVYGNFSEIPCLDADVIIDFSSPKSLDSMLDYMKRHDTPAVIATTGYTDCQLLQIDEVAHQVAVFRSANMSLGINLLISLAQKATKLLNSFDIEIVEAHHNQKVDAPSGTALMLADAISQARDTAVHYEFDRHSQRKKREKSEIGIHSVRGGTIVGEHEIIFAGHDEVIRLSHSAASKEVFAQGAIRAAGFLKDQSAGLYDMDDLLKTM